MNSTKTPAVHAGIEVIRANQVRMRPSPDKQLIALCDMVGNLDILDSGALDRTASMSLGPYVDKEFFDDANLQASIRATNLATRYAASPIHAFRFLKLSGSCGFAHVAIATPAKAAVVVTRAEGTARLIDIKADEGASALAFSSDGELLAIGDYRCRCRILELEHLSEIAVSRAHEQVEQGLFIKNIDFSPDSTLVASINEGLCSIWEARSGRQIAVAEGADFVKFSPTGQRLVYDDRRECFVWDFASGAKRQFPWFGASITAGDWSLSGQEIVTGDYKGRVHVRNVESGDVVRTYVHSAEVPVEDLCWVKAGIVALFGDGILAVMRE